MANIVMWKRLNNNSIRTQVLLNLFIIYIFIIVGISVYFYISELVTKRDIISSRKTDLMNVISMNKMDLVSEIYLGQTKAIDKHLRKIKTDSSINKILLITTNRKYGDLQLETAPNYGENRIYLSEELIYDNVKLGELRITADIIDNASNLLIHKYGGHLIIFACSVILISLLSIVILLRKKIILPIMLLSKQIENIKNADEPSNIRTTGFKELDVIVNEINELREKDRIHAHMLSIRSGLAAIGSMSSHIAHDMRSPLSVLKGYAARPVSDDDPDMQEYQAAAQRSVDKLLHMADDLVDYSKASKVERSQHDVKKLICDDVMAETGKSAVEHGVTVRCELDKHILANIDAYRMERVLVNLVNNAVQAIDGKKGEVVVKAEVDQVYPTQPPLTKGRSGDLVISVVDNGKGISAEDLSHVFDSFFTKGKKGGTGLGLAYCKQVVEAHGGSIDVESEAGKGTKFTIRIPGCVVECSPLLCKPALSKAEGEEAKGYRNDPEIKCDGKRFILIDDDADIRLRWRRIVRDNGGTVVGEADSYESMTSNGGLNYADADVAIVDYNYEGSAKNGIDVISYLRTKGIKEIHMCTGHAYDDDIRAAALSAGADSVIAKEEHSSQNKVTANE
ncbi:MAG: hybrid sensor histidine kinase/response regulator [Parcubacteria group bacterium]